MMMWNNYMFNFPSSYMMEILFLMNDYVMMFLISITFLVVFMLVFFVYEKEFLSSFFTNHNLEMIWTIIPFIILVAIAIPSLVSLYMLDSCFFCPIIIKIMGHQWYWSYSYVNLSEDLFDSYMSSTSLFRLAETDNCLILPYSIPLRFCTSSIDVIHSWTIPSLGVKMDSIPGRINQYCLMIKKTGLFMGQCSEICGANHSFMPILVESVSLPSFLNMWA